MKSFTVSAVIAVSAVVASTALAKEITVVNFGGAVSNAQKPAYIEPFEKATGIKVNVVEYSGEQAKVKAMVDAKRVTWDVVEVESGDIGRACEEGLYEKIDADQLVNKKDFLVKSVQDCGIGAFVWTTAIAYNADRLKTAPTSWKDFWDVTKFPGKRGMRKGARYNLEFALMADGVPTSDVYKVLWTKEGVERAFRKLDELKSHIQWWTAGAQPPQMLVAGDLVMSTAYSGRIDAAQREGKNLKVVWTGHIYEIDFWAVPKGSPNRTEALNFIKFASSTTSQAEFSKYIAYGPTNMKALAELNARILANLPTSPANGKDSISHDFQFWTNYGDEIEKRFASWVAK